MFIGKKDFDTKSHTYVMGILNVTPDSFSDGGQFNNIDAALRRAAQMVDEGVDIIDIGGESTRPGFTIVSAEEEINRVVPVIEAIKREFDVPISLDTTKSSVARAGIDVGADMINDIWGLKADTDMASVIAKADASVCIMHNRKDQNYVNLIDDICSDLDESLKLAHEAGIKDERIVLDPGVGFAKDTDDNLKVIANLEEFGKMGYPVLLGCSRKSVIGNTLNLPVGERLEGTLATTVMAGMSRTALVRVHDVLENVRAVRMCEKILCMKN